MIQRKIVNQYQIDFEKPYDNLHSHLPIKTLDAWLTSQKILKDGDTTTVFEAHLANTPVIIKRYNLPSLSHKLKRLFGPSRAKRAWLNHQTLQANNIDCVQAIALLDPTRPWFWPWPKPSYLIMEKQNGVGFEHIIASKAQPAIDAIKTQIVATLKKVHALGYCHGDTKATNFIIDDKQKAWLIDLDGMKRMHNPQQKDFTRFERNFIQPSKEPSK